MWSASSVVPSRSRTTTAGCTCSRAAAAAIVWESLSEVDIQRRFAAQNWSTQQCGKKQINQQLKRLMHPPHFSLARTGRRCLLSCGDSTRAGFFRTNAALVVPQYARRDVYPGRLLNPIIFLWASAAPRKRSQAQRCGAPASELAARNQQRCKRKRLLPSEATRRQALGLYPAADAGAPTEY